MIGIPGLIRFAHVDFEQTPCLGHINMVDRYVSGIAGCDMNPLPEPCDLADSVLRGSVHIEVRFFREIPFVKDINIP